MAAMIQAEKTQAKVTAAPRRALGIVVAVLGVHGIVLAALATFTPKPMPLIEPPKPIAVRFVEITPPKPELPKPKPPQPKPKELPKKPLKPKEVKVVKAQPKPQPAPKPKPVLSTPTPSKKPQAVVSPIPAKPEPLQEPVTPPQPEPTPEPRPQPKPEPAPTNTPVLVEGVSYIKPPRLTITEKDLKGQARTVRLKITIASTGTVDAVQVVSSSGLAALDQKVAKALKKATFTPHRVNGVAVPSYTIQPFELNLPN